MMNAIAKILLLGAIITSICMNSVGQERERNIARIENCYAVETAHSAEKFNWEKGNGEEQQMVKMKSVPCEIR